MDSRVITAIFYLNKGWSPKDGGQLRLYPFPKTKSVDIDPIHDRMVLFSSRTMLHRVLPSHKERYCFTIWISERNDSMLFKSRELAMGEREAARVALMNDASNTRKQLWELLRMEEVRKHAVKWVYRDEWLASLIQSHPSGNEQNALLARFNSEMEIIEHALRPLLPILEEWRATGGGEFGFNLFPRPRWL